MLTRILKNVKYFWQLREEEKKMENFLMVLPFIFKSVCTFV